METLRVGVVGTGLMARSNAQVLTAHPMASVTAVASRSMSSAQHFADDLGAGPEAPLVQAFDDVAAMLGTGVLDAIVVATPDHLHADVVVLAAQAGVHVLVEKPFTTSVADADRAVAAVRSAGVVAMCLFNHRWVPAYAQAKDLMPSIGPTAVAYARKNDTLYVPTQMIGWAADTTCAWFLSSHDIDLITWLADDEIVEVFATARWGKLRSLGIDTPDAIQIQATFSTGSIATFESGWIYPDTFPTMVDSYVTIVGDSGVIQLDRQRENILIATADSYSYPRNMLNRTVHGVPAGAYRDAIGHFVDCARSGTEPIVSIESSRHVTAVLAAAHESIRTRQPTAVSQAPS
jgi:predicted dehydrogenase